MENANWLERWEKNSTAFHQTEINPFLIKCWEKLQLSSDCHVLVPLCGKSLDMLWLINQGHSVIGVELSDIACEAFFSENKLPMTVHEKNGFKIYSSNKIQLYCGDIFSLIRGMLPNIGAIYDRAALIAFPPSLRQQYADHLSQLIGINGQMLLISLDSPDEVQGPPYIVNPQEINQLFSEKFTLKELTRVQNMKKIPEHLQKKGYRECFDLVYHLKLKSPII